MFEEIASYLLDVGPLAPKIDDTAASWQNLRQFEKNGASITGFPPYITNEGAEQFLVNLLTVLQTCLKTLKLEAHSNCFAANQFFSQFVPEPSTTRITSCPHFAHWPFRIRPPSLFVTVKFVISTAWQHLTQNTFFKMRFLTSSGSVPQRTAAPGLNRGWLISNASLHWMTAQSKKIHAKWKQKSHFNTSTRRGNQPNQCGYAN